MKHDEMPVGTRVRLRHDKVRAHYGTIIDRPVFGKGNTVEWDDGSIQHYVHGEVRALREGEEEKYPADPPLVPPEVVLLRMVGGPHAGDRQGSVRTMGGWPLPERLEAGFPYLSSGFYRKVSESQITDEQIAEMTHVLRGAQYEWVKYAEDDDDGA